ncbi:hypothetical protein [Streptomyces griseoaurantiacus]|uniref:hypothetical protein n=1 Tax=Streptomyces griseoaurantiacus TaxID=68213 RepID=UPI003643CA26
MPKDRIVGQDRGVDADRQLRPVGDGVVDGVVDHQESGPVAVEVAEGVPGPSICTSMLPWTALSRPPARVTVEPAVIAPEEVRVKSAVPPAPLPTTTW